MAAHWFSDFEMDEPSFFHQWQADSLDQFTEQQIARAFSHELHQTISSESNNTSPYKLSAPLNVPERPKKFAKSTNSWDSCITEQSSSSPTILSFGRQEAAGFFGGIVGAVKPKEETEISVPNKGNNGGNNINNNNNNNNNNKRSYEAMAGGDPGVRKGGNYTGGSNQDHILAERKRREKLSQRFIALSKIVPGLKKMDKASVLGDAIKYLKQLQEKVQSLEAQATKRTVESAVIVKRSRLSSENGEEEEEEYNDSSSCDENFNGQTNGVKGLPEIEARMSERTVLIKIHCENRKGFLVKALTEIEKLGLSIMSTNVIPFAGSSLDITAMAQVEEEFSMSVKDIVKTLNLAFKQFK